MSPTGRPPRSTSRLFALHAVISLLPVLVLGFVLAGSYRSEVDRQGLAEGLSEARLVAQSAVEPVLNGPVDELTTRERGELRGLTGATVGRGTILRLRIRDLQGRVVFSGDGSGLTARADDEALAAAAGKTVALLTSLNSDRNDTGAIAGNSVEVYLPLRTGREQRQTGVLELYLPYAPISRSLQSGLHSLYLALVLGLGVLYLVLFLITASVSKGWRREAAVNAFLAEHDTLTGLPNRTLFLRRAQAALAGAGSSGASTTIALLDLDRFKDVNDTLGHHSGDGLLIEIARRLSARLGPEDTVARLGGDEFGLILAGTRDPEPELEALRAAVDREVTVNGLTLTVQVSIGYVIAPEDGTDVGELLQRSDVAMYMAKARRVGFARYDAALDHYDATTLALATQLRRAIQNEELVLHYQPQLALPGGQVSGFEALVRWQHPEFGLLSPDRFLPQAEQTDAIDELTAWVLATALRDLRGLIPATGSPSMSVNVSARSLARASFAQEVIDIVRASGADPRHLIIEVTETALLADPPGAARVLRALTEAGIRISLDDFGRGQTSLGHLPRLPIHELKVDRSFIASMLENPAHAAIVRSMIELGHNLGLTVVGEGVETDTVMDTLRELGCDTAQGFLIARPMPLAQLERWLRAATRAYPRAA